jgi:hypothetical protein
MPVHTCVAGLALAVALLSRPGQLLAQLEVQIFGGTAASLPLPVTIAQAGQPDIHFTARWNTRPTHPAPYFAWRIGFWSDNRGWRLDHTHHKLYLVNFPADVEAFRITNGFNILTLSRAYRSRQLTYSIGAGPVITYPISRVRGKRYDHDNGWNGYHLSGASAMAMITREFPLTGGLVLSLDARASGSYVRIPVVEGHANVPNAALHLHAGIGYLFGGKRRDVRSVTPVP